MELDGIDHMALSVSDTAKSARWYIDVLGFEDCHHDVWNGVPVFLSKGTTALALFPVRDGHPSASAKPPPLRFLHLAFRADRNNFLLAQEELKRREIKFEFQDHDISHSIYFRDPDGHQLEITSYEL